MFSRFKEYAVYSAKLTGAALSSASRLATSMGDVVLRTLKTAKPVFNSDNQQSTGIRALAVLAAVSNFTVNTITRVPAIFTDCFKKDKPAETPAATSQPLNETSQLLPAREEKQDAAADDDEHTLPTETTTGKLIYGSLTTLGWASLVFATLAAYNGGLTLLNFVSGESDPNDDTHKAEMLSLIAALFQAYSFKSFQLDAVKSNASALAQGRILANEATPDWWKMLRLSPIILVSAVNAAFSGFFSSSMALTKIPLVCNLNDSIRNIISSVSILAGFSTTAMTFGPSLYATFNNAYQQPNTLLWQGLQVVNSGAGFVDSAFTGISSYVSFTFLRKAQTGINYTLAGFTDSDQIPTLVIGVVLGACSALNNWVFSVTRGFHKTHKTYCQYGLLKPPAPSNPEYEQIENRNVGIEMKEYKNYSTGSSSSDTDDEQAVRVTIRS